ncbi:MAG TPA: hypothetical protein VHL31_10825 [Geminicoccus sp.]|jgi:lipopolysaccharide export LptBFGC system permease protein LptF|nr:hypothetical protein [Geminicoccus sp.]HEX2526772.1 hypothetical protein [Geminicoccus sp.]
MRPPVILALLILLLTPVLVRMIVGPTSTEQAEENAHEATQDAIHDATQR